MVISPISCSCRTYRYTYAARGPLIVLLKILNKVPLASFVQHLQGMWSHLHSGVARHALQSMPQLWGRI